jgi:2-iminobutanoate/2-iminopropanoate deaminase
VVKKTQIQSNLNQIEKLYQKYMSGKSGGRVEYFSKLAIIETCGWIEESMDDIIRRCANKHLKESKNIRFIEGLIGDTHSFKYHDNFRNMLIQTIGIINVEKIEQVFDTKKFLKMTSSLGELKQRRDNQAHTYIKGTTLNIDAPSLTKNRFQKVYEGLKDIEACLRKTRL